MMYKTIQGEEVPALGLGTWLLRGDACREAVTHALDIGYRHIDTAQAYDNETEVGQGMQDAGVGRERVFLTTKVWFENLAPTDVRRTAERSLRRLQTEYVDLLLIHWPNERAAALEHTLDALLELKAEGKTRHVGVSNFTPTLVQRTLDHTSIFCNQVEYHPYLSQETLLALARAHSFLLTAYAPIARGKVMSDDTLRDIGATHGKTPAQIALRWLIQQDQVAAIPKASSAEHREQNVDLFDFELSGEEMTRIFRLAHGQRLVDPAFAPAWEN